MAPNMSGVEFWWILKVWKWQKTTHSKIPILETIWPSIFSPLNMMKTHSNTTLCTTRVYTGEEEKEGKDFSP